MENKAMELLRTILDCGEMEMINLEYVQYDWDDVLKQIDWPAPGLDFNDVMRGVIALGVIDMCEAIRERRNELEMLFDCDGDDEAEYIEEKQELEALGKLNPDTDIECSCNGCCIDVWFKQNESIYRKWLQDEINEFEENTGFDISEGV